MRRLLLISEGWHPGGREKKRLDSLPHRIDALIVARLTKEIGRAHV